MRVLKHYVASGISYKLHAWIDANKTIIDMS